MPCENEYTIHPKTTRNIWPHAKSNGIKAVKQHFSSLNIEVTVEKHVILTNIDCGFMNYNKKI